MTPDATLNGGLTMPCVNCTMMRSTINSILILMFRCFRVMNELVDLKSKKQLTILLFILKVNFNKLEALLLWAPLDNQLTLGNVIICTQGSSRPSFARCLLLSQLKHLTLDRFCFTFFTNGYLPIDFSLSPSSPDFICCKPLLWLLKSTWFL